MPEVLDRIQDAVREKSEAKFRKAALEALCEGVSPLRLVSLMDLAKVEAAKIMDDDHHNTHH